MRADGGVEDAHLRRAARDLEPARQCAAPRRRRARRPGRDPAAAVAGSRCRAYRDLQARRHRAAARDAVRCRGASAYRLAEFRRQGADHQCARASPSSREIRAKRCRPRAACCRSTAPATARVGFARRARARVVRLHRPVDTARGRSGADDLHLGHHRPAQGRAARATACCSAICPASNCRTSSCRSPATASGRRPTGPGPAVCSTCCCRACIYGVPVVARRFEKFDPEEAFALMARLRRAQRLHSADRAAHAARGRRIRAGATTSSCASIGSGGEALGARRSEWGTRRARPHHQRVLRPDRMQPGARRPARAIGVSRPGAIGKPVPGHAVAIIDADGSICDAGRDRADRGPAARPGDVPRILGQARTPRATKFIGDWMTTGDQGVDRRGRLRSVSSAATTTSSPRPATASARARSRTA